MSKRILIIEEDDSARAELRRVLEAGDYEVCLAEDGARGLAAALVGGLDLIISAVSLSPCSGLEICRALREAGDQIPFLLLDAECEPAEKAQGLRLGADDYVSRPFDETELLARVEALLRRATRRISGAPTGPESVLRIGSVSVDLIRSSAALTDQEEVRLTSKELALLSFLAEHRGVSQTRERILREVWGHQDGTLTRTVDMHIVSLRQKLEKDPKAPKMIVTVPGHGYKVVESQ